MRFDPSKPHGLVYGEPGVAFHQNGRHYRKDGTPVDEEPAEVAPEPVAPARPKLSLPPKQAEAMRKIYDDGGDA